MNFAAGDTSCNTEKQIAGTERLGFVATFREQVWFQLAGTGLLRAEPDIWSRR